MDRPTHYDIGHGLQVIDMIEYLDLDFHLGNALKYLVRAGRKSPDRLEDLRKAAWYLRREIELAEFGSATTRATDRVLDDVRRERLRQEALKRAGKFEHTCADEGLSDPDRLAILGEEYGEISRDVVERGEGLGSELVQLAAVAVAWREHRDTVEAVQP